MNKDTFLNLTGILFLLLGISAIINTIYKNTKYDLGLASVLWFCYIGMILLGIGVLKRDSFLIISQFNIIAIPLVFWNIDFYYYLIKGSSLFGIVDYYFIPGSLVGKIISSQHLFTIPLTLIVLFILGLKEKNSWKLSFFEMALIFFVTRLVTTYDENVNCVFKNCANFDFGFWYPLQWFIGMFLLVWITNWIVIKILRKK